MKLYDTPLAPNPRRVRWVLAEKGVTDIEIVTLNIMQGDHRDEGYVARAGMAVLPALELDDGEVLTESVAICRYLEALYPEPNLFGSDPLETARIEMWLRRAEMLAATPLMMSVRLQHPALAVLETPNPAVAEHYLEKAGQGLALLDRRLEGRDWIAADRITMADIAAFIGLDFARMIRFRPPPELANLNRWAEAMRARPAARAGGPKES